MTEQEMLTRIQELEEENAKLRGKQMKKKVSLLELFERMYPWLRYSNTTNKLSELIRLVCFHEVIKPRKLKGHLDYVDCEYLLQTKDMTDEQKARFVEIAGKLLTVLDEYEVITDTEAFKARMKRRNTWDEWYDQHYGQMREVQNDGD